MPTHTMLTRLSNKALLIILAAFFGYLLGFLSGTIGTERTMEYPVCELKEPHADHGHVDGYADGE